FVRCALLHPSPGPFASLPITAATVVVPARHHSTIPAGTPHRQLGADGPRMRGCAVARTYRPSARPRGLGALVHPLFDSATDLLTVLPDHLAEKVVDTGIGQNFERDPHARVDNGVDHLAGERHARESARLPILADLFRYHVAQRSPVLVYRSCDIVGIVTGLEYLHDLIE